LLLATDQAGETMAAVAALKRTIASAGLHHHTLAAAVEKGLLPAPRPEFKPEPERARPHRPDNWDWRAAAFFCFHRRSRLSAPEAGFIANIYEHNCDLTERQERWLLAIEARLRRGR
jgi:hypothetical protein